MKLTDERSGSVNFVRSYSPGELRIHEQLFHRSCLLTADQIIADWKPQTLEELELEHLEVIVALEPEVVVLGSGLRQRFPEARILAHLLSRRIGCEVMDTGAACRTFNILLSEDRRVVAALFLGK
jgi:uncharacterized protein